jgi:hypothetical protein
VPELAQQAAQDDEGGLGPRGQVAVEGADVPDRQVGLATTPARRGGRARPPSKAAISPRISPRPRRAIAWGMSAGRRLRDLDRPAQTR